MRVARLVSWILVGVLVAWTAYAGEPNADALTFRQILFSSAFDDVMNGPLAAVVSPDGEDVYVSATTSETIVQFRRDTEDGALEFADAVPAQFGTVGATRGAYQIVVSPDDRFVYAAVTDLGIVGAVVRFDRNLTDGSLVFGSALPPNGSLVEGLHSPVYLAQSPDGRHLYILNDQSNVSPFYSPSIAVVSTDTVSGTMLLVQNLNRAVAGAAGYDSFAGLTVSPDGFNVYVAGYALGFVEIYNRDPQTGMLTPAGSSRAPRGSSLPPFIGSVAVSPDGLHAYATDVTNGFLGLFDRSKTGDLTGRVAWELPGAGHIVIAPDGTRVYVTALGDDFQDPMTSINAYERDLDTGELTLIESISDGISGVEVLRGPTLPAISADGGSLYVPAFQSSSLGVFVRDRPDLPCNDASSIDPEYDDLADFYSLDEDVDQDGLPDIAALALVEHAACNGITDNFDEAITNAYLVNLLTVGAEEEVADTGAWQGYQRALSALLLTSQAMRTSLNQEFSSEGQSLLPGYQVVTCTGGNCEPANAAPRSADEPFSGDGDADGDGVTNAEEWANVMARGGSVAEFAVSALDPANDGSMATSSDTGVCFIATAAYGTPLASELDTLRAIRDSRMLTNSLGTAFADAYYRLSPPAAKFIAGSPLARDAVRSMLSFALRLSVVWPALVGMTLLVCAAGIRRNTLRRVPAVQRR